MSKTTRTRAAIAVMSATAIAAVGCSSAEDGGDGGGSLSIAIVPVSGSVPVLVAEEQGFFEDEGLDVEIEEVPGPAAVAALQSGEVDLASLGASVVAAAAAQGLPLQVVSGRTKTAETEETDETAIMVPADSGIEDASALTGLTIGTQTLTSQNTLMARNAMVAEGGDPDANEFVDISFPDMAAALRSGSIDAAVSIEPFVSGMEEDGMVRLVGVGHNAFETPAPIGVIAATQEMVAAEEETVEAFRRAFAAAVDWVNDDEERLRETLPELIDLTPEQAETVRLPTFDTEVTREGMQTLVDAMVEWEFVDEAPELDALVP